MTALFQMRLWGVACRVVVCLVAAYAVMARAPAAADEPSSPCPLPRAQDQLWLVSDRGLGCPVEQGVAKLKYWRYGPEQSWVRSDLAAMQTDDQAQLVTTVFVHGNRVNSCEAFATGWRAYRALVRCADGRPVRFIIWSWPADRVCGPVNDARTKAWRTNPSSYYLARFVDQLDPQGPLSFWGHSFGARIVTGALHLLGGGKLAGRRLPEPADARQGQTSAVLIAAALDNGWLLPRRAHGLAISQVSDMLLVKNSCDAVLKRYHWVYHRRSCREALGYTGLAAWCFEAAARKKIKQVDACCQVGRQHQLAGYLCSPSLVARMRQHLLPAPREKPPVGTESIAAANPGAGIE